MTSGPRAPCAVLGTLLFLNVFLDWLSFCFDCGFGAFCKDVKGTGKGSWHSSNGLDEDKAGEQHLVAPMGSFIAVFIACVPLRLITLPSLLHCAYAFPWLLMHAVRRARQQTLVALVVHGFQYLHEFTGESKRLRPPMSKSSCQT